MALDMTRIAAQREEAQKQMGGKGTFWKIPEGETKVFIHGQCFPEDTHPATKGQNFIKIAQHFGVGGKKGGQVCLNLELNPCLLHPRVVKAMGARKKNAFKLDKNLVCPTCQGIESGEISGSEAEKYRIQFKYLFGLTPMFFRQGKLSDWAPIKFAPTTFLSTNSVFNIITGEMMDAAPVDITDPTAATFVRLIRKGRSFEDTEYDGKLDMDTAKKAFAMDKGQRRLLAEAMEEGGSCDLFKVFANLLRSPSGVKAMLSGVQVEEDDGGDEESGKKICFGVDFVAEDKECKSCEDYNECGEAKGEFHAEKAAKTTAKAPSRKKAEPEPEPEEESKEEASDAAEPEEAAVDGESAEGESSEEDPESEAIEDSARPGCFGTFEDNNADCEACDDADPCQEKLRDILRARASKLTKSPTRSQAKSSGKTATKPAEKEEDDPELAALEREAAALHSKKGKK
jgi:hypothetical protein